MKKSWNKFGIVIVLSAMTAHAGLFGDIRKSPNGADSDNSAAQMSGAGNNTTDNQPYLITDPVVNRKGKHVAFPFETLTNAKNLQANIHGYSTQNGAWYFANLNGYWVLNIASDSGRIIQDCSEVIAFDPSAIKQTSDVNQLFVHLKPTLEDLQRMDKAVDYRQLVNLFGTYLDAKAMLQSVKSGLATTQVQIYKGIKSGDTIEQVKREFSSDSSITVLNPDATNCLEFTSSYLEIPCKGVVTFSSMGRVATVNVTAISQVEQQDYINKKVQQEMQTTDAQRAIDDFRSLFQTTEEKLDASKDDLNTAALSLDIEQAAQKWNAAIKEKYPTGFNNDHSVEYISNRRTANFSIVDVAEAYGDGCKIIQKQLNDVYDSVEVDFRKFSASKNDF